MPRARINGGITGQVSSTGGIRTASEVADLKTIGYWVGSNVVPIATSSIISTVQYLTPQGANTTANSASTTASNTIAVWGQNFSTSSIMYINNTTISFTYGNSSYLTATVGPFSANTYTFSVVDSTTGTGAAYLTGIQFCTPPVWTSYSGAALAGGSVIFQLAATGAISYSLTSGDLSGLSLSTLGLITGTYTGGTPVSVVVTAYNGYGLGTPQIVTILPTSYTINYLVVAGGGGGGGGYEGGGGGGGGLVSGSATLFKGSTVTIGVGSGGTGAVGGTNPSPYVYATPGTLSYLNGVASGNVIAQGGGVGGGGSLGPTTPQQGTAGGSGGGGSGSPGAGGLATSSPGAGIAGIQGYPGGATNATAYYYGGGGGGAGGTGVSTPGPASTTAIPGGVAALWPYTGGYYAGGGGGGARYSVTPVGYGGGVAPGNPAKGGAGDGGSGGTNGGAGTANTGGGGGGGGNPGGAATGGTGGSGVVILAVPTPQYPGSAPGATVSTPPAAPGMTIITFNSPGTYTA